MYHAVNLSKFKVQQLSTACLVLRLRPIVKIVHVVIITKNLRRLCVGIVICETMVHQTKTTSILHNGQTSCNYIINGDYNELTTWLVADDKLQV